MAVTVLLAAGALSMATPAFAKASGPVPAIQAGADSAAASSAEHAASVFASLGNAGSFSVLAGAAITAPGSSIGGDIGAAAAITVDANSNIHGVIRTIKEVSWALADLENGYIALRDMPSITLPKEDLGGLTLNAGVYHSVAAIADSATLAFDAQGDKNAVFLIQTDGAVNITAATRMVLLHGAKASNIYWVSAAATTIGAGSVVEGNIISHAAITIGAGSILNGRALSVTAAITADANDINVSTTAGQ